ncbi:MAG: hypothetical protein IJ802_00685 [Kiritimatiellae bacterium]|nr:hypothetical protein [Kiritimatiellia bacterium]
MKIHLLGIGGVGMSALAQAYLDMGYAVQGADRELDKGGTSETLETLRREGVKFFPEAGGAGIDGSVDALVITTAIEANHPGLAAAEKAGVRVVHRAKALAEIVNKRRLIAVTGTCGKSTVTAMLGHILAELGADPLVVNGAAVTGWDADGTRVGSVRNGKGEIAVIEADESDKSLVAYKPWGVVVTNASADHYGEDEMNRVFDAFIASSSGGPVVDGRKGLPEQNGMEQLPMPGKHNRANALLAMQMARMALPGVEPERVREAMGTFGGVVRRLEKIGERVYDDYAHNTEKLKAALVALQELHPQGVAMMWRPHGYAPLRKMKDSLAEMFVHTLRRQDVLVLPPVYDAGGTADRSVNSQDLVKAMIALDPCAKVNLAETLDEAEAFLLESEAATPGMAVAVCGARDPALPHLARRLAKRIDGKESKQQ